MWEHFILKRGFRNIINGGQVTGFQFKITIPYYRGIWVSCIQNFAVKVDGILYPLDKVSLKIGNRIYPWNEVEMAGDDFWYFGNPATIIVEKPGGLAMGLHKVECALFYEKSYYLRAEDDPLGLYSYTQGRFDPVKLQPGQDPFEALPFSDTKDLVLVI